MKVLLVGSDCEENLGLAMVAAALTRAGHRVEVIAFNEAPQLEQVAERVVSRRPRLVGLGMQFQHRALEFLELGRRLRCLGFSGHLTCGGQYPTMAHADLITYETVLDSIVLHEGEATVVELAHALERRLPLSSVAGLALRGRDGELERTAPRPATSDLDALPFAHRYRQHTRHLGLPFIPVSGSRGCWGSCAFCSITTTHRSARHRAGGRLLRLRSPANIAAEMALLWHAAGGRALFCFHDETLLLPRPADTLSRLGELRDALDALGVGEAALIGKCRPDCLTTELAHKLKRLGVVRLFVGIENGSQRGLDHLNRRVRVEDLEQALSAASDAGIMVCYNLLLFEPDAVLDDVRENIEFIRRHPSVPVNFCRAEAYHGTPLFERLRARGALFGSHLGWDYRITDDRTELAYRIAAAVFRERNFAPAGVANQCMGLGYQAQLLRILFDTSTTRAQRLLARADALVQDISLDTARLLEQVVDLAEHAELSDHERIVRQTAQLALSAAAHNRLSLTQLTDVRRDIEELAAEQNRPRPELTIPERLRAVLNRLAVASCCATVLTACGGEEGSKGSDETGGSAGMVGDSGPGGSGGFTPHTGGSMGDPAVGGSGGLVMGDGGSPSTGGMVVDPAVGGSGGMVIDPVVGGSGGMVIDPVVGGSGGMVSDPASGGTGGLIMGDGGSPSTGGMVVDPAVGGLGGMVPVSGGTGGLITGDGGAPSTGGVGTGGKPGTGGGMVIDCAPQAAKGYSAQQCDNATSTHTSALDATRGQWQNTGPRRIARSRDLPLFEPPEISLEGRRCERGWEVSLQGGSPEMTVRWWNEEGSLQSTDRSVVWSPASPDDELAVAVRTSGGIAVATFRAPLDAEGG